MYEQQREVLLAANANLRGLILREPEQRLDRYLTELKTEYRRSCSSTAMYEIPVLTDETLRASELYRFCSRLPKGADQHVHDMALLPVQELTALLRECPEICISKDKSACTLAAAAPDAPVPEGYLRFAESDYTAAELLHSWTVAGAKASGMGIWDYFETLFDRHAVLSDNPAFAEKYYNYAFRYYCRCRIQHVEIHMMMTGTMDETAEYLCAVQRAYRNVKKEYPYFTVRVIGAGVKADGANFELTKRCFLNASYVQEIIKDERGEDFVIGFDLVNEEDTSLSLHEFAPLLLKVKKRYPNMRFYIHGGESLDAGNENLIDAYLLGAARVGHGLNLYRYPDLHARFIREEICLEVCPVSNQRLGYTTDIRNHPATEYLRTGLPLALCSDDPAYMEYETLTDDFFAGVVGWDLSLGDLKQLGINSIMYSGLDHDAKYDALRAYHQQWDDFVAEQLSKASQKNGGIYRIQK